MAELHHGRGIVSFFNDFIDSVLTPHLDPRFYTPSYVRAVCMAVR